MNIRHADCQVNWLSGLSQAVVAGQTRDAPRPDGRVQRQQDSGSATTGCRAGPAAKVISVYSTRQSCQPVSVKKRFSGNPSLRTDPPQSRAFNPGVIGHRQWRPGPIRVLPDHRNMVAFSDHSKAQARQGSKDPGLGSIRRKLGHQRVTLASATNASKTGGSVSNTSIPNDSM